MQFCVFHHKNHIFYLKLTETKHIFEITVGPTELGGEPTELAQKWANF